MNVLLRIMNAVSLDFRIAMLSESRATLAEFNRKNCEWLDVVSAVSEFRQNTLVLVAKLVHVPSQKITKRFSIPLE